MSEKKRPNQERDEKARKARADRDNAARLRRERRDGVTDLAADIEQSFKPASGDKLEVRLGNVEKELRKLRETRRPFIFPARKGSTGKQFTELAVPTTGTTLAPMVSGGRRAITDTDPVSPIDLGVDDWILMEMPAPNVMRTIRIAGGAIKDMRYNAAAGCIQVTYVSGPTESDWVCKIPVNSCPSNPARASTPLFGTNDSTDAGPEGGYTQMTLASPNTTTVKIDTACTDFAGTNSVQTITAGASGATVVRIDAFALGSTSKGAIRIFHQPGGSGSKYFVGQIDVPYKEVANGDKPWSGSWTPEDATNGFLLEASDKIYVGTYVAENFNVKVNGADLS